MYLFNLPMRWTAFIYSRNEYGILTIFVKKTIFKGVSKLM